MTVTPKDCFTQWMAGSNSAAPDARERVLPAHHTHYSVPRWPIPLSELANGSIPGHLGEPNALWRVLAVRKLTSSTQEARSRPDHAWVWL